MSKTRSHAWPLERIVFLAGVLVQVIVGVLVLPQIPAVTSHAPVWFFIQITVAVVWVVCFEARRRRRIAVRDSR